VLFVKVKRTEIRPCVNQKQCDKNNDPIRIVNIVDFERNKIVTNSIRCCSILT